MLVAVLVRTNNIAHCFLKSLTKHYSLLLFIPTLTIFVNEAQVIWSGYCHQRFTTLAESQSVQEEICFGSNIMHYATLQVSESHENDF